MRSPRTSSPRRGPAPRCPSSATPSPPDRDIRCRSRSSTRIGASADNLAGLKVSESPFDRVEPYLALGLPVLIGNEPLIAAGLARGAIGTVSGMSAAFPDVVRAALDAGDEAAMRRLRTLRAAMETSGQFVAAAKHVLGMRGVPVTAGMRAPLRALTTAEAERLELDVVEFLEPAVSAG